MTLEKLLNKHPELEVVMAGSVGINLSRYSIPFSYKDLGSLTLEGTAKLYQDCDIGLCFSMTNLSFLPMELMASGCLCVTNLSPATDWFLKDGENCLLAEPLPSLLLSKFEQALASYDLRKHIFESGLKMVRATSWEKEFERVMNFIKTDRYQGYLE